MTSRAGVFLDRDGVINRNVLDRSTGEFGAPRKPDEFELAPGAISALLALQQAGLPLFLVSNQPNYAKGKSSLEDLAAIHQRLEAELKSAGIEFADSYYCYHHPQGVVPEYSGPCQCRKPSPHFLFHARDAFRLALGASWMIGDRATDIECGRAAGVRTIRVAEDHPATRGANEALAHFEARDLAHAAEIILSYSETRHPRPVTAILAGGLATRLGALTSTIPKSLLPVGGEPFIAHQLRRLAEEHLTAVVICAGYLGRQIENFAGDGSAFGCHVRYSFDGEQLLGTGGALLRALPLLGESFVVLYGDSYLREPFLPVWRRFLASGKASLMTVFRNENRWDESNVEFADGPDGGEILRYDKTSASSQPAAPMRHIDYGLGCIRSEALAGWAADHSTTVGFDLASFYRAMLAQGQLAAFEVKERFYEIGSPAGLAETNALFTQE